MLSKDKLTSAYNKMKPKVTARAKTAYAKVKPITDGLKADFASLKPISYKPAVKPTVKTLPYTTNMTDAPLKRMVKKRVARIKPKV